MADVLLQPRHPYTQALVSVLSADASGSGPLGGEPPDPTAIPAGCRFHPRCPRLAALDSDDGRAVTCRTQDLPVLPALAADQVACHLAEGITVR